MIKEIYINGKYLNIPICIGKEEKRVEIFLLNKESPAKIFEFLIPIDAEQEEDYSFTWYAQIPMAEFAGRTIRVEAEMTEAFADAIVTGDRREEGEPEQKKPHIHFTACNGWTNDPNGLIYDNGVYHLYFQYNPFNIEWNNMTWGHAVSEDLLHWKQLDSVMFPDESGAVYSGCAIVNERALLGLPKDAYLFYYTAAGGIDDWSGHLEFTQKLAYSLDKGETLVKVPEPVVPTIYRDSRDPKVYWHEESKGYIMLLWLKGNDFGILRSEDLKNWELTDEVTLPDGWECPDLLRLTAEDGETCWFFWSADGFYYKGEFDGYHFRPDGTRQQAYLNGLPYAAQTYSGVWDRVISIPWLRFKNDGRTFTGSYGIPVELTCQRTPDGFIIVQKPVRELMRSARRITDDLRPDGDGVITHEIEGGGKALAIRIKMIDEVSAFLRWKINGSWIQYSPEDGRFAVDADAFHVDHGQRELLFLIDDRILEVFFNGGVQMGTFELRNPDISVEMAVSDVQEYDIYEID